MIMLKYVNVDCHGLSNIYSRSKNANNSNNDGVVETKWLKQIANIVSLKDIFIQSFTHPLDVYELTARCNHLESLVTNVLGPKFEGAKDMHIDTREQLQYRRSIPITIKTYGIPVSSTNMHVRMAIKQMPNVEKIFSIKAIDKSPNANAESFAAELRPNTIKLMNLVLVK